MLPFQGNSFLSFAKVKCFLVKQNDDPCRWMLWNNGALSTVGKPLQTQLESWWMVRKAELRLQAMEVDAQRELCTVELFLAIQQCQGHQGQASTTRKSAYWNLPQLLNESSILIHDHLACILFVVNQNEIRQWLINTMNYFFQSYSQIFMLRP